MMRRPTPPGGSRAHICRLCETVLRRPARADRRPFLTLASGAHNARISGHSSAGRVAGRAHTRPKPLGQVERTPASRVARSSTAATASRDHAEQRQRQKRRDFADLGDVAAAVDRVTRAFLGQQGIPSEKTTLAALRACAQSDVRLRPDASKKPEHAGNKDGQPDTTVSHLLDLDADGRAWGAQATAALQGGGSGLRLEDVADKMSEAAYAIVAHPPVALTPRVLAEYVSLQARLGKPETLPHVFDLYAAKPQPRAASGSVRYVKQNPNRPEKAIEADVAEKALSVAIEAKNLDAAIGIIEGSYATKAFAWSKLIRKALLPAAAVSVAPVAAYTIATRVSNLQETMDHDTATGIAFAGILAYLGFTATYGMVAMATANDQMKRVTWAPGTPLRRRWMREEERAAFDRVACSFGFSEHHRYGEEEGEEFQALRRYILRKGMLLDVVELMEGMS